MDRRYMRDHDDNDDRRRDHRDRGGRDEYGRERWRDPDPRLHRTDFEDRDSEDRGAPERPSAEGRGRHQSGLYGRDQRALYRPSGGAYDRRDDRDWHAGRQSGHDDSGPRDWRELYRGEGYAERGGRGQPDPTRGKGERDYGAPEYDDPDYRSQRHAGRGYAARRRDELFEDRYGSSRGNRGFFDRASDEVASWFGDHEAERRREQDHRGRGPKNYQRSDARIQEDVNDALTDDPLVDASGISVKVTEGEVTLDGTVDSRRAKRRAEDCAESVRGIRHVQNNLRVNDDRSPGSQDPSTSIPS